MRVTIFLTDADGERLEQLASAEHRTARQQATVLVLKALDLIDQQTSDQRVAVAA